MKPDSSLAELENQFDELYAALIKYFRLRGFDEPAAADLTAEVFERSLLAKNGFDPQKASLKTWLFAIAHNMAVNRWKSHADRKFVSLEEGEDLPARECLPEDRVVKKEDYHELLQGLQGLDDKEREVISLKFSAHLNNRQIAALMGLSPSNVGIILYRSLRQVRARMSQGQSEESHE